MASIEETYNEWEKEFQSSEESLFHYHPNLERILLGFAIFAIASRPLFQKLGKAEALKILPIYIVGLISAWIDEDDESFETMFKATMPVAEAYVIGAQAFSKSYSSKERVIKRLAMFYSNAVAIAGDMSEAKATALLDDLSTDGTNLYSAKITAFGNHLLFLTNQYGMDIPPTKLSQLMGWH